ncbi:hypothetical protein GW17_00055331, partial [Ensete ventricosum]
MIVIRKIGRRGNGVGVGLTVKLHPLLIVNISDHHTSVKSQTHHSAFGAALADGSSGAAPSPRLRLRHRRPARPWTRIMRSRVKVELTGAGLLASVRLGVAAHFSARRLAPGCPRHGLAKVKSMHRVDAVGNSPGVRRELVEGIESLSGWRKPEDLPQECWRLLDWR